jgi:twitching motility protein PilT
VEFVHKNKKAHVIHREVGLDTASFKEGLKGAVKSGANVILVGEMRDMETIELALNAAEMGILVFGTLHTNSASKTIDRIIDVFPAGRKDQIRTVLSNSLQGIVSQLLMPTKDGKGRCASHEILIRTSALPNLIQDGQVSKLFSFMQTGKSYGMQTMDQSLKSLYDDEKISARVARIRAVDKAPFQAYDEEEDKETVA